MYVDYGNGPDRGSKLSNDIIVPDSKSYVDVRLEPVRHQAIGQLETSYLQRHLRGYSMSDDREEVSFQPSRSYTFIPPLQTLTLATATTTGSALANQVSSVAEKIYLPAVALTTNITNRVYNWLPKSYSIRSGLYVDWRAQAKASSKYALLLLAALIGGILLALPGTQPISESPSKPSSPTSQAPAAAAESTDSTDDAADNADNTGASAATNTASGNNVNAPTLNTANSQPTSTFTGVQSLAPESNGPAPIGGDGDNSTDGPDPTQPNVIQLGPTPLQIPTTTVTVPPQYIKSEEKTIVGTDGTTIIVN